MRQQLIVKEDEIHVLKIIFLIFINIIIIKDFFGTLEYKKIKKTTY